MSYVIYVWYLLFKIFNQYIYSKDRGRFSMLKQNNYIDKEMCFAHEKLYYGNFFWRAFAPLRP